MIIRISMLLNDINHTFSNAFVTLYGSQKVFNQSVSVLQQFLFICVAVMNAIKSVCVCVCVYVCVYVRMFAMYFITTVTLI